ncbi:LLM class flavin-dependent oxidoreductase [Nakamurella leprariae]|uniref:LLM class flavin-dependent oxidoreductase n=1 Tax=Nakamurella leprariae TaxID=2803911 RepID=UPI0038B299E2
MEINCAFATSVATPDHIVRAEQLGYQRAWCYDSPSIYADVWMALAVAAVRTSRIRVGVGVVTPHVRHVLANAAATAHLAALAPGRTDLVVGSGFTSSALIGRKSARWVDVEQYVLALRALLAGESVEWDGSTVALLHGEASGVRLPVDVPIWIAAHGPKGFAVADRVADGVLTNPLHGKDRMADEGPCSITFQGTVLDDGESADDPRVLAAAGPGAALALHMGEYGPVAGHPDQVGHAAELAAVPEHRRHLETHRGHLIEANEIDQRYLSGELVLRTTMTGDRQEVARRLAALRDAGATAVLYQPAGPDIPRELETFAEAAALIDQV